MFGKSLLFVSSALFTLNAFAAPTAESLYEQNVQKRREAIEQKTKADQKHRENIWAFEINSAVKELIHEKLEQRFGAFHMDTPSKAVGPIEGLIGTPFSEAVFSNSNYICLAKPYLDEGSHIDEQGLNHPYSIGSVELNCSDIKATVGLQIPNIHSLVLDPQHGPIGSFAVGGHETREGGDAEVFTAKWNGKTFDYTRTIELTVGEKIGNGISAGYSALKRAL